MRTRPRGARNGWGWSAALLPVVLACGPATTGTTEPQPPPADVGTEPPPADVGTEPPPDGVEPAPVDAAPQEVGALPGPPGADPPGFEPFEPLPEAAELARVLWKIEGPLDAAALRDGTTAAVAEVARCLSGAAPGGRLPLHLILDVSGRVVEVGGPLAEAGLREAITCAQDALRMLRFPEAAEETTLRLIVER
ncbi:MAG: hypothetical protein JXB32_06855 [Deltaproteobacteria bacterium]|nr:hypothetical protein [Deltaproteobacteria bacterium]